MFALFLLSFISVGYGIYLFLLVLHGTFTSHVGLFKINVTTASINWTVVREKLNKDWCGSILQKQIDAVDENKLKFNEQRPKIMGRIFYRNS